MLFVNLVMVLWRSKVLLIIKHMSNYTIQQDLFYIYKLGYMRSTRMSLDQLFYLIFHLFEWQTHARLSKSQARPAS